MSRVKILSRDDFLSIKKEIVEVPELGGSIYIKELGGKSLLQYREKIEEFQRQDTELNESNSLDLMALLVSLTACDKEGNLIFSEKDVRLLAESHIGVLIRLSTKALEMTGLEKDAIQEVSANLKNVQTDSSITS